jgi:hypothetical protein
MDLGQTSASDTLRGASEISSAWLTKSSVPASTAVGREAIHDFRISAAGVEAAANKILDLSRPDILVLLNGLFAAERILTTAARDRGVHVITYENSPRRGTLVFGRASAAPDMDMDALWESAREVELTDEESAALDSMVEGRVDGGEAHERYFDAMTDDEAVIRRSLQIAPDVPILSLFTNLAWDTAVLRKDLGFTSMFDWIGSAIESMESRPDAVLVVRIHPAEVRWGTNQPVGEEIASRFAVLPENVRVVGPEEPLSSYTLMSMSERVLCYTSTVGLEAAVRGTRVAVAGATHYRGRGFTDDVRDARHLRELISVNTDGRLTPAEFGLARRYAFAFFFQRLIPLRMIEFDGARIARLPVSAADLAPGADPCLDEVCARVLDGREVVLPRELALLR